LFAHREIYQKFKPQLPWLTVAVKLHYVVLPVQEYLALIFDNNFTVND